MREYFYCKMNKKVFLGIYIVILITTTGCYKPVVSEKMVPYVDYSTFTPSGKTLNVIDVKVEKVDKTLALDKGLQITSVAFKKAILETLGKSNIFREIYTNKIGDYELQTKIISQKLLPGVTANSILFVHYSLIDTKTKKETWKENILSQYDTYGGDPKNAVEAVVRDNLSKLLDKISSVLSDK